MRPSRELYSLVWPFNYKTGNEIRSEKIKGIQHMETPTTGGQLQQRVCAMQWMRYALPLFSTIIHPFAEFLEKVYAEARKRTNRAVYHVVLSRLG